MITNIKQLAFIISGLTIITVVFLFTKFGNVEASVKSGQQFQDWTVSCNKDASGKTEVLCVLTQEVKMTKDNKQETLAVYQVGYIGPKKELKMIQIFPLGVKLDSGTSIISSKKLLSPGQFNVCTQAGCQAIANISEADLKLILNNNENAVGVMNIDGKQVSMPFSIRGLEEGLKFIK